MTSSNPIVRLAIVVSHPIQYYVPWFRQLAQSGAFEIRVFYLDDSGAKPLYDERFKKAFAWDVDLTSGYDHEFVPNRAPRKSTLRFTGLFNPSLAQRLAHWGPDAVLVFGYNYISHLLLLRWARTHRVPLIFRGDSHLLHRTLAPTKRGILSIIYRQFAAVSYVGQANRDYFLAVGVASNRLFHAPHAVDGEFFEREDEARRARAKKLRRELNISPDSRVILFAGKLVRDKRPDLLLEAFLQIASPHAALIFVGDGELKPSLEAEASRSALPIHFLPFANQSEMPVRYRMADVLALTSQFESWGMVVNEAMHCAVPCLVSDHVGCQKDLVAEGDTGWVFATNNLESLAHALRRALRSTDDQHRTMRARIRERITDYTYSKATDGLRAAVDHALQQHG